eukprot:TRINITY_DN2349_c0_g1_i1.p1 TRINITY_DN2349_c0_g1~~TRINITY_DN2349_c0_g1_i1.p1  ORF type:complete len:607 (-),score=109.08 TRINITY_DN2349_c0_g1_i1:98-1918(-)
MEKFKKETLKEKLNKMKEAKIYGKLLFEYVTILTLKSGVNDPSKSAPRFSSLLLYHFPRKEGKERTWDQASADSPHPEARRPKIDPILETAMQFCFPDIDSFDPSEKTERERFSFVMTDAKGDRKYGYCLKLVPNGSKDRLPFCCCLITSMTCFRMFQEFLDILEVHYVCGPLHLDWFLRAALSRPLIEPGQRMTISAYTEDASDDEPTRLAKRKAKKTHNVEYGFQRPIDDHLYGDLPFEYIFFLGIKHTITLFSAILLEKRVVLISSKLGILSTISQILMSLIYPFSWQYIYIPVLPRPMLHICSAPMPFMVGITASCSEEFLRIPGREECYLFDIDNNKFLEKPSNITKMIPPTALEELYGDLETQHKNFKNRLKPFKEIGQGIGNSFLEFFVTIIGNVQHHIKEGKFSVNEFIETYPKDYHAFYTQLSQTQLFDNFIRERESKPDLKGPFEERVLEVESKSSSGSMRRTGTQYGTGKWTLTKKASSFFRMRGKDKDNEGNARGNLGSASEADISADSLIRARGGSVCASPNPPLFPSTPPVSRHQILTGAPQSLTPGAPSGPGKYGSSSSPSLLTSSLPIFKHNNSRSTGRSLIGVFEATKK